MWGVSTNPRPWRRSRPGHRRSARMSPTTRIHRNHRLRNGGVAALAALAVCALGAPIASAGDNAGKGGRPGEVGKPIPGRYIVVVEHGHDPRGLAKQAGAKPKHVYRAAINGFAAELNDHQV